MQVRTRRPGQAATHAYEDIKDRSFSWVVQPEWSIHSAHTLPSLDSDAGTTRCACRVRGQSRLASCPPQHLRSCHDHKRTHSQEDQDELTYCGPRTRGTLAGARGSCRQPALALLARDRSLPAAHTGRGSAAGEADRSRRRAGEGAADQREPSSSRLMPSGGSDRPSTARSAIRQSRSGSRSTSTSDGAAWHGRSTHLHASSSASPPWTRSPPQQHCHPHRPSRR